MASFNSIKVYQQIIQWNILKTSKVVRANSATIYFNHNIFDQRYTHIGYTLNPKPLVLPLTMSIILAKWMSMYHQFQVLSPNIVLYKHVVSLSFFLWYQWLSFFFLNSRYYSLWKISRRRQYNTNITKSATYVFCFSRPQTQNQWHHYKLPHPFQKKYSLLQHYILLNIIKTYWLF